MLVIGHRGAPRDRPENTLAAFAEAYRQGADGVELDVRTTSDGALACSHDDSLADGRVLRELRVEDLPPDMPLLAAALDTCAPLSIVNIEIKNWPDDLDFDPSARIADEVVALLEARDEIASGRYLLSGFHLATVDRVRAIAPQVPTAWLVTGGDDMRGLVDQAADHGHRAIHPHHAFVNDTLVGHAHDAGLAVNTWTCDDPDRIRWLADIGVDAVVTNVPAVALSALGR